MNPRTELIKFFNRTQYLKFEFKTDPSANIEFFDKIQKEIHKIADHNILQRPDSTTTYLLGIISDIETNQKYIHKRYILDIQEKIKNKIEIDSKIEAINYEEAGIILWDLEDIKDLCIERIKWVKPELIVKESFEITSNIQPSVNPKYLKPNGKRYIQFEVALYLFFNDKKIYDPRSGDHSKLKDFVNEYFGFNSTTSAEQIYYKYKKLIDSKEQEVKIEKIIDTIHLKTELSLKWIKKGISAITEILNEKGKEEAKKYLNQLDLMIN